MLLLTICEVLAGVFCVRCLQRKFAGTSCDSLLFLFEFPIREQVLGKREKKRKKKDVQTFLQESYDRKCEIMNSIEEGDTGCLFLPLILKSQFDLQVSCWSMQLDTYLC